MPDQSHRHILNRDRPRADLRFSYTISVALFAAGTKLFTGISGCFTGKSPASTTGRTATRPFDDMTRINYRAPVLQVN